MVQLGLVVNLLQEQIMYGINYEEMQRTRARRLEPLRGWCLSRRCSQESTWRRTPCYVGRWVECVPRLHRLRNDRRTTLSLHARTDSDPTADARASSTTAHANTVGMTTPLTAPIPPHPAWSVVKLLNQRWGILSLSLKLDYTFVRLTTSFTHA